MVLGRLSFLVLIIATLLVVLTMTVPVRFIAENVVDVNTAGISGLDGNLIAGSAQLNFAKMQIPNRERIAKFITSMSLSWDWCPASGILTYCVTATSYQPEIKANGKAQVSPWSAQLEDTQVKATAIKHALFGSTANVGSINLRLDDLAIDYDKPFPTSANGQFTLQGINANLKVLSLSLGNLRGVIRSPQSEQIDIRIQGKGNTISKLNGTLALTPQDYRYQIDIDSANLAVQTALLAIGKKGSGGYRIAGNKKW